MCKNINTFDIDGVIYIDGKPGVRPGVNDVIITGRSHEERFETYRMLEKYDIKNTVIFNDKPFNEKTRLSSGLHKGQALQKLMDDGYIIGVHFEDDLIQIEAIKSIIGDKIFICHVNTNGLVELENKRHG